MRAFGSELISSSSDWPDEGPFARAVARFSDAFSSARPQARWLFAASIVAAQLAVTALVLLTEGTQNSAPHLMYLAIAVAGFLYGPAGGAASGVLAGVLVGPFMPLDVANGLAQPTGTWLFRLTVFAFTGVLLGSVSALLRARLARSERLKASLSQTYARNLRLFAGLVAQRDEITAGHCERVAQNSVAIGRRLGLKEGMLRQLYWSGLLHDLGKIGVPEEILRKPGRLTEEEFAVMRRHARLGRDVLLSVSDTFGKIAAGVYAHHERWDGTGYPRRLAGEDIPLFGRIIAVADVFEAVTSKRSYRDPMELEHALHLVEEGSGTHFDPAVVEAFLTEYAAGAIAVQENLVPLYDSFLSAFAGHELDGFEATEEENAA